MNNNHTSLEKAALVILLTNSTTDWLAENDPQALKQLYFAVVGNIELDKNQYLAAITAFAKIK